MSHIIDCPNCSKRYRVADDNLGKRVRCQQCGAEFTIAIAATSPSLTPLDASDPFDPLAGTEFSSSPTEPPSGPLHTRTDPLGTSAGRFAPLAPHARTTSVSNPSGGPTDAKMRLTSCGMLAFGVVLTVGSVVLEAATGTVYLVVVGLVPLMLILGIAGVISPNVVRSIGKYGGHLPWYYKAIGWGLIGLSMLLMIVVLISLFMADYQTGVPRPRRPVRQSNPRPPARTWPSTAEDNAASEDDAGASANSSAKKPLKAYPVTIAVPPDSQFVPATAVLPAGTRLQACWAGKWNPITFLSENSDGTLTVRWDDFGEAFDCRMIRNELIIKNELLGS